MYKENSNSLADIIGGVVNDYIKSTRASNKTKIPIRELSAALNIKCRSTLTMFAHEGCPHIYTVDKDGKKDGMKISISDAENHLTRKRNLDSSYRTIIKHFPDFFNHIPLAEKSPFKNWNNELKRKKRTLLQHSYKGLDETFTMESIEYYLKENNLWID